MRAAIKNTVGNWGTSIDTIGRIGTSGIKGMKFRREDPVMPKPAKIL